VTHDPPPARATRAGGGALAARMGPLAPYLPAVGVLAVWIAWAATSGGYFPRDWYPGAVALVVLLAVVVLAGPRALPAHRAARLALALLVGLVAWAYLSMAWAGSAGAAWEAANLLLAYLASAWLLALVPWGPRSATLFLGTWSVGVAAVCLASLIGALGAEDPNTYIVDYRWSEPVGYTNGSAALAVLGAWPALVLASRRETPSWLTPFLLGRIGPAILWLGALLASLLTLDRLLAGDHEDGSLDLILMSDTPLELAVAAKAAAHWLTTGLPLVIATPLLGLFMNLDGQASAAVALTLLAGTPALTFIGLIGAALSVALRRGGLLLAVLVLPLTVPVLIFGVAASNAAIVGPLPFGTPFTILCALTLVSLVVGIFAAAAALRQGMD